MNQSKSLLLILILAALAVVTRSQMTQRAAADSGTPPVCTIVTSFAMPAFCKTASAVMCVTDPKRLTPTF